MRYQKKRISINFLVLMCGSVLTTVVSCTSEVETKQSTQITEPLSVDIPGSGVTESSSGHNPMTASRPSASFEVAPPDNISPHVSPDFSQVAIVEPPGTLIMQEVASQEGRTLLIVDEISSLTWYPDGKFILFSIRDRANQQTKDGSPFGVDELWVVNLETGETYPLQDQYGQVTGRNLREPYISPDGHYIAAIGSTSWADDCFVDRQLWVREIRLSGDRLQEIKSYSQLDFTIQPTPETGEMYVKRIVGWDSPTHLRIDLIWTCIQDYFGGIYMLDMNTLTAEKIGGAE